MGVSTQRRGTDKVWLWLLLGCCGATTSKAFLRPTTSKGGTTNNSGISNGGTTSNNYRSLSYSYHQYTRCLSGSKTARHLSSSRKSTGKKTKRVPRPPRFTQTVHKSNRKMTAARTPTPRTSTSGVLRNKSVEDLEAILAQRWGTNLSSFTAEDWDEDDDVDDNGIGDTKSGGGGGSISALESSPTFRGRPVVDPWNKETTTSNKVKEFYDVDDEGYENNQDGGDFDYLIAPRPAGNSGRTQSTIEKGGYFLRPPPQAAKSKTPDRTEAEDSSNQSDETKKVRRQRSTPIPVLDEDGETILLSTVHAERLFRKQQQGHTVSKLTTEIIEDKEEDTDQEDDSPLVTLAAENNARSWSDLGVTDTGLLDNLESMRCSTPLPVQQSACPAILGEDRDIVVGTYTGSGKTLAFLVPILQRLLEQQVQPGQLSVLIVAPGRELASQIVSVTRELCRNTPYTSQLAIGGTTFSRNLQTIRQRKPSILVGTPGRLAELIVGKPGEKSGRLKLVNLRYLVLDEFDALLEYKPHREPTDALVHRLRRTPHLQSILCSATATDVLESPKLQRCIRPDYFLAMTEKDDIFVTAKNDKRGDRIPRVSKTVMHGVVHVPHRRFVIDTIRRILHTEPIPQQILMFVESSRKVDLLVEKLANMGILAAALHGGSRNDKMDRAEVSKALREGYVGIVVATELAARGLDAPLLTHVINVDLPTDASHYAHRAGRCGRGGRPGVVINITSDPKERTVPLKFTSELGVDLHTVDVRDGRLNVVNPDSLDLDNL